MLTIKGSKNGVDLIERVSASSRPAFKHLIKITFQRSVNICETLKNRYFFMLKCLKMQENWPASFYSSQKVKAVEWRPFGWVWLYTRCVQM